MTEAYTCLLDQVMRDYILNIYTDRLHYSKGTRIEEILGIRVTIITGTHYLSVTVTLEP